MASWKPVVSAGTSVEEVRECKEKLLKAKSRYAVQKEVVDSVLMMYPILKAVHQGTFCSPIERDLTPYLIDRDAASVEVSKKSTGIQSALEEAAIVQGRVLKAWSENASLASDVHKLAREIGQQKEDPLNVADGDNELDQLKTDFKISRQKWLVMKGTASAVVAGSGIDWARDPELMEIVLDPEDMYLHK
ncbi:Centromere protein H (CENP-H) [Ceratocystis platani]|uniref:Centromere protein H (CENP-H) n=1 Tax=Ceratocystis fimbriata f. sp. platani TaxID=88771 RepID=A0A0F8DGV0_CERFI|nr:Centromere protein H (CENP-H) [Ceratocystis platani]